MTDDMTDNTFLTQLKTHPQVQNFRFLMILLLLFLLSLCYEDILPSIMSELQKLVQSQARIHTGFHRFTEIRQIFHKKLIFNNKNFPSWNLENGLDKCFLFPISGNLMPFFPPPSPLNESETRESEL